MRDALFLARHDLRRALRERETLVWVFLMPIVFFFFIGSVTGGSGGGGGERKDALELAAGADAGFLADELERSLGALDYEVTRTTPATEGEDDTDSGGTRLELPAGFTARVLAGEKTELRLRKGKQGLGADYATFRAGRAVYTLLASLAVTAEADREPGPGALAELAARPRALVVTEQPAGRREHVPHGFEQAVPGTLVMFTMIALLTTGAVTLVVERRQGLLRRLASTPVRRSQVVLGKWLGLLGLGLAQVLWGMVLGGLFFGVDWGPDVPVVLALLTAWAALVAGFAILLGSLARTEGQAIGIAVLAANVLAALGGCWWPIEITPAWMQRLALFLPTGWAMDAIHQLVSFQNGPGSALWQLGLMGLAALVVWWLAARRFRFA